MWMLDMASHVIIVHPLESEMTGWLHSLGTLEYEISLPIQCDLAS